MRAETRYYAFDDTEFDTATECIAYEDTISEQLNGFQMFDKHGQILKPRGLSYDELNELTPYVAAIYIVDVDRAKEGFRWLEHQTGWDLPPDHKIKTGEIWYDTDDEWRWINLTERHNKDRAMILSIQNAINAESIN